MGQIPVSVAKKKVNKHFAGQNNYHGKMRQLKRCFFFSITTFGSYRRARLRFVSPTCCLYPIFIGFKDHYAAMDASRDASVAELRRAYLKASVPRGRKKFSSQDRPPILRV